MKGFKNEQATCSHHQNVETAKVQQGHSPYRLGDHKHASLEDACVGNAAVGNELCRQQAK